MTPNWLEALLFGRDITRWNRLAHTLTGYRYFQAAHPDTTTWTLEDHAGTGWKHFRYPNPDPLPSKPWHPDGDAAFTTPAQNLHPRSDRILAHMRAVFPSHGGIRIETGDTTPNRDGKVEGYVWHRTYDTDPEYTVTAPLQGGPRNVMVWDGKNWPSAPFGAKVRIAVDRLRTQGWPLVNYSDRKTHVFDGRTVTEIHHVEVFADGGIRAHGVKQVDLSLPSTEARGTSAAGVPPSEFQLRYDDLIRDGWVQGTSMAVVAQAGASTGPLPPARSTDGKSTSVDAVPFGAVLRIRPEAVKRLLSKGCGPQTEAVLRCFDVGVMVVDTAGHNFVAFEPDPRWDQADLADIRALTLADFAVFHH